MGRGETGPAQALDSENSLYFDDDEENDHGGDGEHRNGVLDTDGRDRESSLSSFALKQGPEQQRNNASAVFRDQVVEQRRQHPKLRDDQSNELAAQKLHRFHNEYTILADGDLWAVE